MKCITEYYGTTASGKEMATERAREREGNERNTKKLNQWNESRMKGAIGDIVFGMHKVW